MRDKIIEALDALEKQKQCKILFAAESGSRAWGFASADSDYDIRAIYVKPEAWYWEISEKKRDTFEAMLPGDLDISAWELRKALGLFSRCNPSLNEWLGSPIIYYADRDFFESLRSLIPQFFNPIRAGHHYLSLAGNAWNTMNADRMITLKKLFYALRGLFCAMWSADFKTMPPTEFEKLLIPELLPDEILQMIPELEQQKRRSDEKTIVPLPTALFDFYVARREKTLGQLASMTYHTPDHAVLGELLRRMVAQNSL